MHYIESFCFLSYRYHYVDHLSLTFLYHHIDFFFLRIIRSLRQLTDHASRPSFSFSRLVQQASLLPPSSLSSRPSQDVSFDLLKRRLLHDPHKTSSCSSRLSASSSHILRSSSALPQAASASESHFVMQIRLTRHSHSSPSRSASAPASNSLFSLRSAFFADPRFFADVIV